MSVPDPRRRLGRTVTVLAVCLTATAVALPWFARISDLPADDDHTEELTLWMTGDAIGHAGVGWADPLRVVPWGAFMLLVAVAGVCAGLRASGRTRAAARTALWSAVAGFVVTGLAWVGAADGRDTQAFPHIGFVAGVLILCGWLGAALAMLRRTRLPAAR